MLERCKVGCQQCHGVMLGPCSSGLNVRRKAARAASYWRLGAWVISRGAAQGDPAGLQVSESTWAADCPELCHGVRWGCRRVNLHRQLVVRRGAGGVVRCAC
jgi:hypothetical protein